MKHLCKFIILLISIFMYQFQSIAQSKIEQVKSIGYTYYYSQNYSNYRNDENSISNKKYNALLEKNVFKYFDELATYNTELTQKIYNMDSVLSYKKYNDSLQKIISILSKKFTYAEYELALEKYDLNTKSFHINQIKELNTSPINWYTDVNLNFLQIP